MISLLKMKPTYNSFVHIIIRRKWIVDQSKIPTIKEEDLEEKFILGSGPGGQAVNKSANCCMLKHKPTGLVVKCHQERSLEFNRKKARQILITKLDNFLNGEESVEAQKKRQMQQKSITANYKRLKKQLMKKQWKESQDELT